MAKVQARRVPLAEIGRLREQYRYSAECQIVRDSILTRGLAHPYLFTVGKAVAGYGGVWNAYYPDRITEFFTLPQYRDLAPRLVRALCRASGAKEIEVQTNILDGQRLIEVCAAETWIEKLLFEEGDESNLNRPDLRFRPRRPGDAGPDGDWVVERQARVVGAGGWLTHYNPPYADLYMEVVEDARRQGIGSYLVQELRRACRSHGYRAAARCDPDNTGSRGALQTGGLRLCGEIVAGLIDPSTLTGD